MRVSHDTTLHSVAMSHTLKQFASMSLPAFAWWQVCVCVCVWWDGVGWG